MRVHDADPRAVEVGPEVEQALRVLAGRFYEAFVDAYDGSTPVTSLLQPPRPPRTAASLAAWFIRHAWGLEDFAAPAPLAEPACESNWLSWAQMMAAVILEEDGLPSETLRRARIKRNFFLEWQRLETQGVPGEVIRKKLTELPESHFDHPAPEELEPPAND